MSYTAEDDTGLVRRQEFSIERIEDLLSEPVRDVDGKVGLRTYIAWLGVCWFRHRSFLPLDDNQLALGRSPMARLETTEPCRPMGCPSPIHINPRTETPSKTGPRDVWPTPLAEPRLPKAREALTYQASSRRLHADNSPYMTTTPARPRMRTAITSMSLVITGSPSLHLQWPYLDRCEGEEVIPQNVTNTDSEK